MAFTGIPTDAIVFYEQLEADNSKAFWEDNKQRFKEVVRGPAEDLAGAGTGLDEAGIARKTAAIAASATPHGSIPE